MACLSVVVSVDCGSTCDYRDLMAVEYVEFVRWCWIRRFGSGGWKLVGFRRVWEIDGDWAGFEWDFLRQDKEVV